jgi:DNA-binding transcriptional ArsR family regulator
MIMAHVFEELHSTVTGMIKTIVIGQPRMMVLYHTYPPLKIRLQYIIFKRIKTEYAKYTGRHELVLVVRHPELLNHSNCFLLEGIINLKLFAKAINRAYTVLSPYFHGKSLQQIIIFFKFIAYCFYMQTQSLFTQQMVEEIMDTRLFKKSKLVMRALNNKLRQKILYFINEKESITVTEIYTALGLEQSVASQHLAIMRQAGLVKTRRDGKKIYYSVNFNRIRQIHEFAEQVSTHNQTEATA